MPKRDNRTYRTAAAAHAKVMAARQALTADLESDPALEPMRRYPHPIAPAEGSGSCPVGGCSGDLSPAMTQILEQLACQSQLLVDILGAVNALTAATLAREKK